MNLQTGAEEVIRLFPERHVQQVGLYEKTQKRAIIMAYKVIILYRLYMPSYFLGTPLHVRKWEPWYTLPVGLPSNWPA